jgi:hypothetical protein
MTINPQLIHQLVEDHQRKLMASAGQARVRRAAVTAGRRTRHPVGWRR